MRPLPTSLGRRTFLRGTGLTVATAGAGRLLAAQPAAAAGTPADGDPQLPVPDFAFAHPGILHTADDLLRMREAVAAQQSPQYQGFLALAADPRSAFGYQPHNTGQVTSWGRGPANWQSQTADDAAAAYQNALMWYVTQDQRHGDLARDILDTWSASLTAVTGADGQLGAGLQGFKLANAAEILRHGGYQGWSPAAIARCARSLREVWYPSVSGYDLYANGNWDLASMQTIAAIAIFTDDRVMFENALRYAASGAGNGALLHRVVTADGQGQESGRDQSHEQLAAGLTAALAQLAWNQGVDLFGFADNRLLANYEYDARYNLGGDPGTFTAALDRSGKYLKTRISSTASGVNRPIYELAYAHYHSRLGLDTPWTAAAVFRGPAGARVVEGYNEDHPSWGTLTFARPASTPTEPPAPPGAPAGLSARSLGDGVELRWIDSVDPAAATRATGYAVHRAEHPQGPYRLLASKLTEAAYTDRTAEPGHTHHYRVVAINSAGSSPASLPVSAAAGLPRPWSAQDVGEVRIPGRVDFDGERFLLEAGGTDIAGTADSFGFAALRVTGDAVLTARIVHPVSSQYAKAGVMLRTGLDASAAHVSLLLQGLTLAGWSGVWTVRATDGGSTEGTGSTPVPPAQERDISTAAAFPISDLGSLPASATPVPAPYVEAAGDGGRLRAPYWVRVERSGDRFTGSLSPDGRIWTEVGTTVAALPRTLWAGLAHCSALGVDDRYGQTGTAAFDHVTVVSGARRVWQSAAPADAPTDLTAEADAGAIVLRWSGADLAARYTVTRRDAQGGSPRVIADGVGPVGFGTAVVHRDPGGLPGRAYSYQVSRTNAGGEGPPSAAATALMPLPPAPVLDALPGGTLHAVVGEPCARLLTAANDPTGFDVQGLPPGLRLDPAAGLVFGVPRLAGTFPLSVSARNSGGTTAGSLTLEVNLPLPPGWSHRDIGDTALDPRTLGSQGVAWISTPGSAGHDPTTGTFTVRGAGVDLNVNGQGMTVHYAYRTVTGDAVFTARLASLAGTGGTDLAGLLATQSLSPFGLMAGAFTTPVGGAKLVRRKVVAGGAATTTVARVATAPCWLRLERSGSAFTASWSADGAEWHVIGQDDVPAFGDAPYHLGFAVTSRTPGALATAVFDHVSD